MSEVPIAPGRVPSFTEVGPGECLLGLRRSKGEPWLHSPVLLIQTGMNIPLNFIESSYDFAHYQITDDNARSWASGASGHSSPPSLDLCELLRKPSPLSLFPISHAINQRKSAGVGGGR
jgi:hypothetical protein